MEILLLLIFYLKNHNMIVIMSKRVLANQFSDESNIRRMNTGGFTLCGDKLISYGYKMLRFRIN